MTVAERLPTRLSAWGTSAGDATLAVLATLFALLSFDEETVRDPLLTGLVVVPVCLTLAWRRVRPVEVAVLVCATSVGLSWASPGEYPPDSFVLAVLLAVYNCAAWTSGRRAVIAGALTLVLVCFAHWLSPDGDLADFFPFLIWGAAWLAGRLVRQRTEQAAASTARAIRAEQQQDAARAEAVAEERDRISRELHDVVAHAVSVMVVQAGAERLELRGTSPRTAEVLESIEVAGRQALRELRTMLGVLRSGGDGEELAPQPDLSQLESLVQEVREAGIPVTAELTHEVARVPPGVALAAYRLVQEALTNVMKHASGATTQVRVAVDGDLVVEVVDSGGPPGPVGAGAGRGLLGLRERVLLHGGRLEVGPCGAGWRVAARMPLPGEDG
jgi:signal transduction histidine kinase